MTLDKELLDKAIRTVKHEIFMRDKVFKDPKKKKQKVDEMTIVLDILQCFRRMYGDINLEISPGGTDE